ncbi:TPA: hypothetical protein PTV74_002992 [Clostridium botulinum]|uniref:Uncharacterized protein n=1 Tax=Clostridium sporogenes TaxID=1509 RepID=A0AAE4FIP3_CLOSG|nr:MULTISPECIES: hypothetical protein [Clostridium]MDS1002149.1 hypothetical protein [Clostridium sporogenes]UAL61135.1 hypothetical protein K8O96_07210 [Clostridium sporogenes]HDK7138660.1 hypothetical protein [Clostridium botulinum]HDK7141989.1 hypothetical protein [Clostridium botulinum]HDK7146194.1 hypothetical protein [Clostridium botulinum]
MLKVKKITKTISVQSNVQAQGCKDDCKVKVWSGKKEADGWQAGCWSTYQYTPRYNPFA